MQDSRRADGAGRPMSGWPHEDVSVIGAFLDLRR